MIRRSRKLWDPPEPKPVVYRVPEVYIPPSQAILNYRKEMETLFPANPLSIINGGLRAGDQLWITAVPPGGQRLTGVQVHAYRKRDRLLWQSGQSLFGRDPSGKLVYAPYLESQKDVEDFTSILSGVLGFDFVPGLGCTNCKWVFSLQEKTSPSRRLISGDYVSLHRDFLTVSRQQGTIDMNLYRPGEKDGNTVFVHGLGFCRAPYHFKGVLTILTEANGLKHTPLNGGFLVVK